MSGCGAGGANGDRLRARLETAIRALSAPGAALSVLRDGRPYLAEAAGTARFQPDGRNPFIPLSTLTHVRAASISKLATALTAQSMAAEGRFDLDADVSDLLGFELRNPAHRSREITARMLLSHTSSLRDRMPYWVDSPGRIETLVGEENFALHPPGRGFGYCNLGYGLVASALEAAAGERFDRLARTYALFPLGLYHTGFGWSGVEGYDRWAGATLYRREDGRWIAQADDADVLEGRATVVLAEPGFDIADYEPGSNGTMFSPQGGWRAPVSEMARLARAFARNGPGEALAEPVWEGSGTAEVWGTGPQILREREAGIEGGLIGHPGQAYGFHGGAWTTPDGRWSFAYFVTGFDAQVRYPPRERATGFTRQERVLHEIALDLIGA